MSGVHPITASLRTSLGPLGLMLNVFAIVIGLYLLIPILIIFPMSLTKNVMLIWPPDLFSFQWFSRLLQDPVWMRAFARSIEIAVPVCIAATVIGTAAAIGWTYARRWRRALQSMFLAPLILPAIAYALGLYEVSDHLRLIGSRWPVIIGHTMLSMPIVFIVVAAGLAGRDRQLPRAAASLGAGWLGVLWRVELPLLRGSIIAGALFSFAYSFDEIVVALFLSPPGGGTFPVEILGATRESTEPTVAAASMLVIGVAMLVAGLILLTRSMMAQRMR